MGEADAGSEILINMDTGRELQQTALAGRFNSAFQSVKSRESLRSHPVSSARTPDISAAGPLVGPAF